MKIIYSVKTGLLSFFLFVGIIVSAQSPTITVPGTCAGVIANFNTDDNGFNSPSIYGSIFDSSFYYHAGRGYWIDYLPPFRTQAPGAPRVMNIISPPYQNPNPNGTFNVGFYYIVNNPLIDRFQVRIVSVTQTPSGTITNIEATSGLQTFAQWSTSMLPYVDGVTTPVPDPTPFLIGTQGFVCIRLIDPDIQNGENTTFRVEVTYLMNTPFFAVFDNLSIGPIGAPLPVDFIGLVANRTSSSTVDLKWDVSSEVDVREYQVERSSNGSSFTTVGTVSAKGKSIYSFTNHNVPSSTVFYRVKSVDLDGRFKYSGILKLSGNSSHADQLKAYPSPARDEVTIEHKKLSGNARIVIISVDGQVMKIVTPKEGASHTPVNISRLAVGMYFVRLENGTGDVQTVRLIKN